MKIVKRIMLYFSSSPYLLLILAVFFWAANFIIGRAVRGEVSPVALAFWRWSGASVLAMLLARRYLVKDWGEIKRHIPIILLLALLGIAAFNTLVYMGLQYTIAVNALLMQSVMPVIIIILSFLLFRERVTHLQGIGVAISLLGAFVIISKGDPEVVLHLELNKGDVMVFTAVVCYGLYSVLLRKRPPIHPLSFIFSIFFTGTLILFPVYLQERPFFHPFDISAKIFGAVVYVALFPSIISFLCFNRGVELIGPNRAGIFIHLLPVFGSIMAIIFLGESLQWFHSVGILCIAIGIFLTSVSRGVWRKLLCRRI